MYTSMPIRPQGLPEFTITGNTTGEELEGYRKNNSSEDTEGLLRSDYFDACVLKAALVTENFFLIKHIIDLKPEFVNIELDSFNKKINENSCRKQHTPLCYAIQLPGYGAECNKTILRILTFLCARGANVNRFVDSKTPYTELKRSNHTPLYSAADRAWEENLEFVKTLICFGAHHAYLPPLPEGERYQKYEPENIYVADIPRYVVSMVKEKTQQAWDALYAEHRNIYIIKFDLKENPKSEFQGFPVEVFTHFARASIQHCYRSNY